MFAYKVTNLINGKAYIGITRRHWRYRWQAHIYDAERGRGLPLHCAIRKYGADAFIVSPLYEASSAQELLYCERGAIAAHGTLVPRGYNLTSGGDGCYAVSAETREKMRRSFYLRMTRPGEREKLVAGVRRGNLKRSGSKRSAAAIEATANARRGKPLTLSHRLNIRNGMQGNMKLNEPQVAEIRRRYAAGEHQSALANEFAVTQGHISRINSGNVWAPILPSASLEGEIA